MTAVLTRAADAVVAAIAAKTDWSWPETAGVVTAVRQNLPRLKREELQSLRVTVVPRSRTGELVTRGKRRLLPAVHVVIQRALATGNEAETDPLLALGEEIVDHFQGRTIGGGVFFCREARYGEDDESRMYEVNEVESAARWTGLVILVLETYENGGQSA